LKHELGLTGPHLIITPLAVLHNWASEFTKFSPHLSFRKIYGASAKERDAVLMDEEVQSGNFDVYLTTFETVVNEEAFFTDSWPWATITIDESHRLKNQDSILRHKLNRIPCPFRLLLTGTPLQVLVYLYNILTFIYLFLICVSYRMIYTSYGLFLIIYYQTYLQIHLFLMKQFIFMATK
jgi:SNF2 family DNA or RNA helicase